MVEREHAAHSKETETYSNVYRLSKDHSSELADYLALLHQGVHDVPGMSQEKKEEMLAWQTHERYQERLENEEEFFFYAAKDASGNIIGLLDGRKRTKPEASEKFQLVGHFAWTVVDKDHRNQGIGKKLKRAFERDCARLGIPMMTTFIQDDNAASLAMNRAMGYTPVIEPTMPPVDGGRYYSKPTPTL